jgi:hypothetical protein
MGKLAAWPPVLMTAPGAICFQGQGFTMLAKIHPDLLPFAVPLVELNEDPENSRSHPEENLEAIAQSLEEFGQDQILIAQKAGMVVRKGNGRLKAARRLGWTHLACLIIDEPRLRAAARAIADNRTSETSRWSEPVLAHLLREFQESGGGLAGVPAVGFTEEQVRRLIGGSEGPASSLGREDGPAPGRTAPDAAESEPAPATTTSPAPPVDEVRLVTLPMGSEEYKRFQETVSTIKTHKERDSTVEVVLLALEYLADECG